MTIVSIYRKEVNYNICYRGNRKIHDISVTLTDSVLWLFSWNVAPFRCLLHFITMTYDRQNTTSQHIQQFLSRVNVKKRDESQIDFFSCHKSNIHIHI